MIKKSILVKNKKYLKLDNLKYQIIIKLLKLNIFNFKSFLKLNFQLQKFNKRKTIKLKRCFKTGRSRGFISFFGFGRHSLKEFLSVKLLPGIRKSSW